MTMGGLLTDFAIAVPGPKGLDGSGIEYDVTSCPDLSLSHPKLQGIA
jgi:hypothetical protein